MFNIYAIIVLVVLVGGGILYIRWDAVQSYITKQENVQLKHNEVVRKKDDKIKRESPDDVDKRHAIEWLQQRTRRQPMP